MAGSCAAHRLQKALCQHSAIDGGRRPAAESKLSFVHRRCTKTQALGAQSVKNKAARRIGIFINLVAPTGLKP